MRRHTEPVYRFAFEIELDEHGGLIANHIALMSGLDGDELRSFVLDNAPIGKANVDLTLGHETHMRVHAEIGPHDGLQVRVPIEAGLVDHALDPHVSGFRDVDLYAADITALIGFHGGKQWIRCAHGCFLQTYRE